MGNLVDYAIVPNASAQFSFGSLTATTLGSATAVWTANHLTRELLIASTLNADYWLAVTLPGVATANLLPLPAGAGAGIDAIRVVFPVATVVSAYAMSGTATSGWLAMTGI